MNELAARLRLLAECLERGEPTDVDLPALQRVLRDGTDDDAEAHRRLRVAALRLSEERLYLALSAAGAMIYSRDLALEQLLEVRGASHVLGDAPSASPIDDEWLESRVHPEDALRVATERSALLAQRARRWRLRYRLQHADGHYVTVEDHAIVLHGEAESAQCVGVVIDAQERADFEETVLRESKRKDEFLAMLGHELRNPLAAIQSAMDVITTTEGLDPTFARVAEVVDRQSRHMSGLVGGILDASRIARGKVELERGPVDMREIVGFATQDARARCTERGVELVVRGDARPRPVDGDAVRLRQILDNLLANAARHATQRVVVESGGADAEVWVAVEDDGPGLDAGALEDVFAPFFQGPQRIDRPQGGLGLGLSVARGIAELHGGRLLAYSDGPGKGARFVLRLPRDLTLRVRPGPRREPQAPPDRSRVLLVEDNEDVAAMLAIGLERHGFHVRVVGTGRAALAALAVEHPDVIICDLGLPGGLSGFEVAEQVRALAPSVRLLAMTGYGGSADRRRAADVGFDRFLVKPLPLPELVTALMA